MDPTVVICLYESQTLECGEEKIFRKIYRLGVDTINRNPKRGRVLFRAADMWAAQLLVVDPAAVEI